MAALAYFHKSIIFRADIMTKGWQENHFEMARDILCAYLTTPQP
jgi:hypothetical protein